MMKHLVIGLLVTLVALAGAQEYDSMDVDALYEAAKAEGQVVVYSFTSRIYRVEEAFEAAYPGVDLVPFDISSTEQIARIRSEMAANIRNADVAYVSDAPVVLSELVVNDYLVGYVPPAFADRIPDEFEAPLLGHRLSTKVLMYNEAAYPDGSPIDNLWQLTLPEWRGKVVMVDPLVRGDYLDLMTELVLRADEMAAAYEAQFGKPVSLTGEAQNAGEQFIADLFANDVVLVNNTDAVNSAVGTIDQKDPPVGFTSYSDRRDNEDEGWALQVSNSTVPSPGILFPAYLGVLGNAPHPAAARLFIHFMMGDDSETGGAATAPFYVPGDYLTRTDLAPHPDAVPLEDFAAWRMDPAASASIRQQVADFILMLQ